MIDAEILAEIRSVPRRFESFFSSRGYRRHEPEPLVPRSDDSLLFTNSTIVPLKSKLLAREIPTPGWLVTQPCLRFQNLRSLSNENPRFHYLSHFTQVGLLARPDQSEELMAAAWEFLVNEMKIERERVIFKTASGLDFFNSSGFRAETSPTIVLDGQPECYYNWTYGLKGVSGRGLTIAIATASGEALDIGNIIEIRDDALNTIAFEFGFGTETLLSRIHSLKNPIACSPAALASKSDLRIFGQNGDVYRDLVQTLIALSAIRIGPGRSGREAIVRRAMFQLLKYEALLGLTTAETEDMIWRTGQLTSKIESADILFLIQNLRRKRSDSIKIHGEIA